MHRRTRGPVLCLMGLSLVLAGCSSSGSPTDSGVNNGGDTGGNTGGNTTPTTVTFVVHLPANTPASDDISFYSRGDSVGYRTMTRMAGDSAVLTLDKSDFPTDGTLEYRYSRDGSNFIGAEYLEPDTNDHFWTQLGRVAQYVAGATQEDTVGRWRWFPQGDATPPEPQIDAPVSFLPRVSGQPFQPGAFMQDFYSSWMSARFQPTADHLAQVGYGMAGLAPPWHVLGTDPVSIGIDPTAPDYTTASLTAQIQAMRNAGLEVFLQPQVTDTPNLTGTQPAAWWDQWFAQMTHFLVYHAQIAQAAGATWLSFYPFAAHTPVPPSDLGTRYRAMLDSVRQVYTGRIGITFDQFSTSDGTSYLIPDPSELDWTDAVDFFVFQPSGTIVEGSTASTQQLVTGATNMMAPVQSLAEQYGVPMLVIPVYASLTQSWRGSSYIDPDQLGDPESSGEAEWAQLGFTFSQQDQARVLDAWFRVAAQTPVVQSVLPFGYWNLDLPLAPDYSIRGKSAEQVVEMWR